MTAYLTKTDRVDADYVWIPPGGGLAGFWMMRTPVTNAMWRMAVISEACEPPRDTTAYDDVAKAHHPVVWVRRAQARAYAAWVAGRLPTEAQWTRAAQGDDGRTYPWGDTPPDATRANAGRFVIDGGDTTPVGAYPAGASPYGVLDMAGNVWEWVEMDGYRDRVGRGYGDHADTRYGPFLARGGAFSVPGTSVTCSARREFVSDLADPAIGLRVIIIPGQ
jgi:formylglycine-generating enzyme required for sulfatase activity